MTFGDYIVYVDESGDHGPVSAGYPVFVLAFCIFKKSEYAAQVTTALTNLKFKWWGHDAVILHERDIRKQKPPFAFLAKAEHRSAFMEDLTKLIDDAPFTIIATVIRKDQVAHVRDRQNREKWPAYPTAMRFCLERLEFFLSERRHVDTVPIVFEQRGKKEDDELELEFRRRTRTGGPLEIHFAPKSANHCGHQLADLVARPIGLHVLHPEQPNRAYEVLARKFRRSPSGKIEGFGLKVFPR